MSPIFTLSILAVIVIVISGLATHGATKGEKRFIVLILLNIALTVLISINGIVFYSMIDSNGYQIILSFFLVPMVLLIQLIKIIQSFRSTLGKNFSFLALLVFLLLCSPFLLFVKEETDLLYQGFAIIYFSLAAYHLLECLYLRKQKKIFMKKESKNQEEISGGCNSN